MAIAGPSLARAATVEGRGSGDEAATKRLYLGIRNLTGSDID
ncbi:MAG: hypothetical protein ACRDQA_15920 [Nocardioidaceae bacterium]